MRWGEGRANAGGTSASFFSAASTMAEVYDKHQDEDGFLYVVYSGENTFGGC